MAKWLTEPIKKRLGEELGKGVYDKDPTVADKNIAKLDEYISAPRKHKTLQEEARGLVKLVSERKMMSARTERPMLLSAIRSEPADSEAPVPTNIQPAAISPIASAPINTGAVAANTRPVAAVNIPERREVTNPNPCPTLYDPCTREPLAGMPELEKRIRDLKRQNDTTPVGLYGLTNATTNYDFVMGPFLDKSISLDDLVSFRLNAGGQIGSDIYEVLSRLFVFFGGITDVNPQQGGNYQFMEKVEASAPRIFVEPKEAFISMKCKADSTSGVSDITLIRKPGATGGASIGRPYCESECSISAEGIIQTYVMSVKWYKQDKNAEHYDLEKLKATADTIIPAEGKPYGIIVFLKSKRDFERAHQRASRQYIRHIGKTYFGWEEDVKPFLQDIRRQIFEEADLRRMPAKKIVEDRYFVAGAKPTLGLQLHQEIITQSVCNAIEINDDNRYLVGVLPRGGKTYIAGGIIREYIRRTKATTLNILWLTAAPTETKSQVGGDLIQKFQDFSDFEFVDVRNTDKLEKQKPFSFFFCSTQLLTQRSAGTGAKNRKYIDELLKDARSLGLIFYDEAHKTATGEKTGEEIDNILKTYAAVKLPLIFLTATYYNILFDYKILQENTFIWDYTDVLKTRGLATASDQVASIDNLKARFRNPELVQSLIERRQANGESIEAMGKPYLDFPELYFISADIQEEAKERFEAQSAYRPDSGLSMRSIFAIRADASPAEYRTAAGGIRADAYRIFENLVNPRNMISLITPSSEGFGDEEEGGTPLAKEARAMLEPTILGRINALSRVADSRFRLDQNPTLMMFMPTGGKGSNIFKTLCAWATLLMNHPWWRERYEVACVVDPKGLTEEEHGALVGSEAIGAPGVRIIHSDPKSEILKIERELHCPAAGVNPKGLVVLAGQKLSMGVSLPCTDVVFLLNDSKSPDDIIQKMYRGLTPSPGKKAAFVVDLNPVRSLAAVYGYTRAASGTAMTSSAILNVIYDTYSWDADVYDMNLGKGGDARPQQFQEKLRQLFDEAEKDPEYRIHEDFGGIERAVGENIQKFVTSGMLSSITEYLSEKRVGSMGMTISLRDGATATLKNGQLLIRSPSVPIAEGEEPPADDTIVIENFIEAVKDFVKYLAITTQKTSLEEAVQEYASDEGFQKNIDNLMIARGAITKRDPRIIEVMMATIRELSSRSRGMTRMFGDMKSKIDEPGARKNTVLQIINKRLTPRQKQKKDHGEVFTPLDLVNEMLDHLPKEVWKNPDLTWLDPANGIGNFPVAVFYRLDEGLKEVKPNATTRRKHIIEKMLFMIELQSSNSRIAKNIFVKLCDGCTPNIWTTDTLKVTSDSITTHGWPSTFDIVMGNPPFQDYQDASGKRGGGDELYMTFVSKSLGFLKDNGFLVFVHPPSWRKPEYSEGRKVSKNKGMFELMTHENQMLYLEIHNSADGQRVFKAGTRYDFYTLQKKKAFKSTNIKDELGKEIEVDLRRQSFLPNYNIENILKLTTDNDDERCLLNKCILYERSAYGSDKTWVKQEKTAEFKYPLIHTTPKTGPRIFYTNTNDKGFFGIPKVIFGDSGINEPVIDVAGEYGMTQHSMAIVVENERDAERLATFLKSNYFTNILSACMWSSFQIDWRLFTFFKQKFWHTEVSLDEPLVNTTHIVEGGAHRSKYSRTRKVRRF